jgi:hypothetical protein
MVTPPVTVRGWRWTVQCGVVMVWTVVSVIDHGVDMMVWTVVSVIMVDGCDGTAMAWCGGACSAWLGACWQASTLQAGW